MNEVLKTIYSRSSVRSYKDEQVSDEDIKEVIKAGFHAANGMNTQSLRFAVIANKDKIKKYSDKGKELFLNWLMSSGNEESEMTQMMKSEMNIFYNAPAVIFIFAADGAFTPAEDTALAAGNIMLAAKSLGLGTCWIGFAAMLGMDADFVNDTKSEGLNLTAALIIGRPSKDGGPTPRNEAKILNWIK